MTAGRMEEIERLNRLYSALGHVNKSIVRTRDRHALFRSVCDALVENGGFRMAWVGWHDPATQEIVPLAQAGDEGGYLRDVEVVADEGPRGRGPTGTAFRENRSYICNDTLTDPRTAPWRTAMEHHGFRACASFPIDVDGVVGGTLSVYASEPGVFREKEITLLGEAAADISFALGVIAQAEARQKAEAAAEHERRLTSDLVEAMPGIFYLYDEQGRFNRWNRNFERATGYSSAEITALHPLDLFVGNDKERLQARIAEVFESGEAGVEALLVAKDGTRTPYYFTGKRTVVEGERRLVGVGIDITDRLRAEAITKKSEERYRNTLDTLMEGCQLIDFDWRYLYLNGACAIQNRRPNAELLNERMQDVWPGIEDTEVFALLQRCMLGRVSVRGEVPFPFPDDTAWFDVRAQPVPEGIFILSIDVSERRKAEQALRELNENLERIVVERTRDLEAARARAEAADRVKSAFLATMSHELRTPLNSIIGFTGLVVKGMAGPVNAEQEKQLGMVQASARHLLELINDVLDISKIEAGQLEMRCARFDLEAVVERVTSSVKPMADKKALSVQSTVAQSPCLMESDERRVAQVLLNLLNNGIKFTDRGGVTLTVDVLEQEKSVCIRVTDTGIGIEDKDLAKLFQPFQQLDTGLQRQHEGTGLGLAISRRLTGLLGGTIRAESVMGRGTTFTVVLPFQSRSTP